ncbi:MAG: hypothetical protein KA150_07345, partial [Propionivibrio sp.]|nr:hypothetical protein [Propionivibrio sp.]
FGEAELEQTGTLPEQGDASGGEVGEGGMHGIKTKDYLRSGILPPDKEWTYRSYDIGLLHLRRSAFRLPGLMVVPVNLSGLSRDHLRHTGASDSSCSVPE